MSVDDPTTRRPRARATRARGPALANFIIIIMYLLCRVLVVALAILAVSLARVWHAVTPIATLIWSRWGERHAERPIWCSRGYGSHVTDLLYGAK